MQESMHEYIKKLSVSLCLLAESIKDSKIKSAFENLQMSLIEIAASFSLGGSGATLSKNLDLRLVLVQTIDLLDLSRIAGAVSVMNAEIITSAALRLLEEVDREIANLRNYTLPRFELSEMSERLLRDRAREENEDKYVNNQFYNNPDLGFRFTNIPPSIDKTILPQKTNASQKPDLNLVVEQTEATTPNLSKNLEPLVYTFFGSEDKIIEDRKAKTLEVLKIGGGAAIGDIAKHFPGLNTKTLQRDLLDLMREKKVIMLGTKRWAKYYLK